MFMREIRRYAAIMELDETVLNRLINRILIGEPKKVDGVKTQEVRIPGLPGGCLYPFLCQLTNFVL